MVNEFIPKLNFSTGVVNGISARAVKMLVSSSGENSPPQPINSVVGPSPGFAYGDLYGVHPQAFQNKNTKMLKYNCCFFFMN